MSAIFSGLTGEATACIGHECQVVRWPTNGGLHRIYVPGSQSAAGANDGAMLVGAGRGEYVWSLGGPLLTPLVVAANDIFFQTFSTDFSYSGLCWEMFTQSDGDPTA